MHISLNGQWLFRQIGTKELYPATVPGCNFLDLMNNGLIPDPFYGTNEKDCAFVGESDWEYIREFSLSQKELSFSRAYLCCSMLDTFCHIYINGKEVMYTDNCHLRYRIPVTPFLRQGTNEIRLLFLSPVGYIRQKGKTMTLAPNSNGMKGVSCVRKPQCHFGWDWGPVLIPSGISGDIGLSLEEGPQLRDIIISQTHLEEGVRIDYKCVSDYSQGTEEYIATLIHPDSSEQLLKGKEGSFFVKEPELWWTREISGKDRQPLYTLKAEIAVGAEIISRAEKRIGLRTLVLDRDEDEYGKNFCFVLNGVPIFAKGANLIPSDTFITRFDSDKLRQLIDAALFSNFNLIRVWGGGYYASDELCDMCDERGILLWQDFAFACQPYPFFDKEFLENVKKEIHFNVKRMSHHPCLALWCGNNEIEAMAGGWLQLRNYVKWTEAFFYDILEKEIRKYDTHTSFIPGSPCGVAYGKGINSDNVGDTHLWSVWHGLASMKQYRSRMTRFCSEFGFESLPDMKTVRSFARKEDYSLDSEVMRSHQKCNSGNGKMFYYIRSRFRLPRNFEDFVYLSQITQLKCIEDATEHWRRNRGRCNGALYWQFNDCWPVCSWSGLDYYGNYKALQYGARHFNKPLTLSFEDEGDEIRAFIINDLTEEKRVRVSLEIFDFRRGVVLSEEKEETVKPLSVQKVFSRSLKKLKREYAPSHTGLALSLYENGVKTVRRIYLFSQEKDLRLPEAEIKTDIKTADKKILITLSCDTYARLVRLESDCSKPFSDNCFDLLPGEERVISLDCEGEESFEEIGKSIRVNSLTDIPTRKITLRERASQIKMLLSPVNIGNCIFHRKKAKDVSI